MSLRAQPQESSPDTLLETAIRAALLAGAEILDVYVTDFGVEEKDDASPLTLADRRAHRVIEDTLRPAGIPVLSEEGRGIPFDERKGWKRLWIVDPLDGTKEFVKRNGEFTVNIALVEDGWPVLGVILAPVGGTLYWAAEGMGAWKVTVPRATGAAADASAARGIPALEDIASAAARLPLVSGHSGPLRIVASRSHLSPETEAFIREQEARAGSVEIVSMGSSLKICLVAEGSADLYPRFAPTMEWDTAAGQAIAEAAGRRFVEHRTGVRMRYNREQLRNDWFLVR